jgi:hypothetical protein
MNRIILIALLDILLLYPVNLFAQEAGKKINRCHFISLKTQFVQIKDKFNYGLVFRGGVLGVGYSFLRESNKNTLLYSTDIAFGANYSKGIGFVWNFQPMDFYYGFRADKDKNTLLTLGPYISASYKWQLYPELQSGHMFWFTSYEVGPRLRLKKQVKNKLIKISISNSLAGWTSRPQPATETTFYTLNFADFFGKANSKMKFGSFNLFNHTDIEIEIANTKGKKLSFAYEFEYCGYYKEPEFSCIFHSLNLKWKIGKKNKE